MWFYCHPLHYLICIEKNFKKTFMPNIFLLNKTLVRPINYVPKKVIIILAITFSFQIFWHASRPGLEVSAKDLPIAPSIVELRLIALGDSIAMSKMIMLWLQAFDNQPGISIPFLQLNYSKVILWLSRILSLDEKGQYPLIAASRLYSLVPDEAKKRMMLEFVYSQFFIEPNRRWPSLAHSVYVAKHQLNDLPLALKYAEALTENITLNNIPQWVKQMKLYVLEDMGEIESAMIFIGGMLQSGAVTDENELKFLHNRLKELKANEIAK